MVDRSLSHPVSTDSAERLAAQGLRMALLDPSDREGADAYFEAVARGFLGPEAGEVERRTFFEQVVPIRRTVGVWDEASTSRQPVATVQSWDGELSVPGERVIPSWAITMVTVAPTHHRRGIARALLEGELRTAADLGLPMAMLTVSEATLYGRYGFGPALPVSAWEIETRRAGWAAPTPEARVEFIDRATARRELAELHERVRRGRPGEIAVWGRQWDQITGIIAADQGSARKLRFVRAVDAEQATRGIAVYSIAEHASDFTKSVVSVDRLDAETDDASAALWRFLLELDLVGTLKIGLRPVDDPIRWLIADQRAATETRSDHGWLRVLDVAAVLEARAWIADGELALDVDDPLGYAEGAYVVRVADGAARVERVDEVPDGIPGLALGVSELSSLSLGGVRASTLVAAGRVGELEPGSAHAADLLLRSAATPWLSVWY